MSYHSFTFVLYEPIRVTGSDRHRMHCRNSISARNTKTPVHQTQPAPSSNIGFKHVYYGMQVQEPHGRWLTDLCRPSDTNPLAQKLLAAIRMASAPLYLLLLAPSLHTLFHVYTSFDLSYFVRGEELLGPEGAAHVSAKLC